METILNFTVLSGTLDGSKFLISSPHPSEGTWLVSVRK
jgi:hypothetical protein